MPPEASNQDVVPEELLSRIGTGTETGTLAGTRTRTKIRSPVRHGGFSNGSIRRNGIVPKMKSVDDPFREKAATASTQGLDSDRKPAEEVSEKNGEICIEGSKSGLEEVNGGPMV
jgi:hypothetical protein